MASAAIHSIKPDLLPKKIEEHEEVGSEAPFAGGVPASKSLSSSYSSKSRTISSRERECARGRAPPDAEPHASAWSSRR
jgi:hypothetical protein